MAPVTSETAVRVIAIRNTLILTIVAAFCVRGDGHFAGVLPRFEGRAKNIPRLQVPILRFPILRSWAIPSLRRILTLPPRLTFALPKRKHKRLAGGHMRRFGLLILSLIVTLSPNISRGGGYPDRPIRLVVGFGVGGPTDIPARFIADKLSAALGQRVFVENKPASGGIVATRDVIA